MLYCTNNPVKLCCSVPFIRPSQGRSHSKLIKHYNSPVVQLHTMALFHWDNEIKWLAQGYTGVSRLPRRDCQPALLDNAGHAERKFHLSGFFDHQMFLRDIVGTHFTNKIFETAPGDFIIILLESFPQICVKNFHADLIKLLEHMR